MSCALRGRLLDRFFFLRKGEPQILTLSIQIPRRIRRMPPQMPADLIQPGTSSVHLSLDDTGHPPLGRALMMVSSLGRLKMVVSAWEGRLKMTVSVPEATPFLADRVSFWVNRN
jgi:hypothetical protein